MERLNKDEKLRKRFKENTLFNKQLDFRLPHEFGGLGESIEERYTNINTFPQSMDLPMIKPRTTVNNKNEFNVKIEKTAGVEIANMSLFQKVIFDRETNEKFA